MTGAHLPPRPALVAVVAVVVFLGLALAGTSCAEIQTVCPMGTEARRRIFSGGSEAEWCHRADGVHQGPEVRYYESGARMIEGAYLDGVRHGEWHYYTSDGSLWRRDKWEDGALVAMKVDLPQGAPNKGHVDVLAPTDSMIIKLASADPTLGRTIRESDLPVFAVWFADGRPRVAGHYDREGLRTGVWRFWHEGGGLAREVSYDAGVRHRIFREWHANGQPRTDGFYIDGERDSRWRRWDEAGQRAPDHTYTRVMLPP